MSWLVEHATARLFRKQAADYKGLLIAAYTEIFDSWCPLLPADFLVEESQRVKA